MALIDPTKYTRIDIPHEPGQWVEVRPFITADTIVIAKKEPETEPEASVEMLALCIKRWSYSEEPVTAEQLNVLDAKTFRWLDNEILVLSGIRTRAEKNGSAPQSSPTSGSGMGGSPRSSRTSTRSAR